MSKADPKRSLQQLDAIAVGRSSTRSRATVKSSWPLIMSVGEPWYVPSPQWWSRMLNRGREAD